MRVLIDYRSALREPSGVGQYAHQLVRALLALRPMGTSEHPLDLTLFSSSWKDRLRLPANLAGASVVDRQVPVRVLNFSWHRLGWPTAEQLAGGTFDITHSLHPLLMPSRAGARVVTIHDLDFLTHPERTRAEVRRDYPGLARDHAHRADAVVVVSRFTAGEVERRLGVPPERISICPPGAPAWTPRKAPPADGGYILFLGTLEPRKNVGGLLDAYQTLASRRRDVPTLVLAGRATHESRSWIDRLERAPLNGLVKHIGYVQPDDRRALFEGACLLVQPSFDEGFGMPVLEAMTIGVPVVASNRGALPEVLGNAGALVDPDDPEALAGAIERMLDDTAYAGAAVVNGVSRAAQFNWNRTADLVYQTYLRAVEHRQCASA